jgi:hypothetical protein
MSRNGQRHPARPRIELSGPASAEEAAAIAAAIEQFMRDTVPAPAGGPSVSAWARAGLFEGTGRVASGPAPWGDAVRWGA